MRFRDTGRRRMLEEAHTILARRYAAGEITEQAYRKRLAVLDDQRHRPGTLVP